MPHYSEQDAAQVFNREMGEVYAYYEQLAEQQRPAVQRAIETLRGWESQ